MTTQINMQLSKSEFGVLSHLTTKKYDNDVFESELSLISERTLLTISEVKIILTQLQRKGLIKLIEKYESSCHIYIMGYERIKDLLSKQHF